MSASNTRYLYRGAAAAFVLLASGCISAPSLTQLNKDYSEAYGTLSNQQLLLNLARISQDNPAYFIQLGAFSSQVSLSGTAGFPTNSFAKTTNNSTTNTVSATPAASSIAGVSGYSNVLTWQGGASATISESPTFNFVPLTGDIFAKIFLTPITEKTFKDFAGMGYHADVLVRMLVKSIEIKSADGSSTFLVNHPLDPSYPRFLAFCLELNAAQRSGRISVNLDPGPPAKQLTLKLAGNELSIGKVLDGTSISVEDIPPSIAKPLALQITPADHIVANKALLASVQWALAKHQALLAAAKKKAAIDSTSTDAKGTKSPAIAPAATPPDQDAALLAAKDVSLGLDQCAVAVDQDLLTIFNNAAAAGSDAQKVNPTPVNADPNATAVAADALQVYGSALALYGFARDLAANPAATTPSKEQTALDGLAASLEGDWRSFIDTKDATTVYSDAAKIDDDAARIGNEAASILTTQLNALHSRGKSNNALALDQDGVGAFVGSLQLDKTFLATFGGVAPVTAPSGQPGDPQYPILRAILADPDKTVTYHLRTLEGLMYSAAKEENYYRDAISDPTMVFDRRWMDCNGVVSHSWKPTSNGVRVTITYADSPALGDKSVYSITYSRAPGDSDPPKGLSVHIDGEPDADRTSSGFDSHPILTLSSYENLVGRTLVAKQKLNGLTYYVGDSSGRLDESVFDPMVLPSMTNRNVFGLIAYLYGKTALSPTELPIQQLIQVH